MIMKKHYYVYKLRFFNNGRTKPFYITSYQYDQSIQNVWNFMRQFMSFISYITDYRSSPTGYYLNYHEEGLRQISVGLLHFLEIDFHSAFFNQFKYGARNILKPTAKKALGEVYGKQKLSNPMNKARCELGIKNPVYLGYPSTKKNVDEGFKRPGSLRLLSEIAVDLSTDIKKHPMLSGVHFISAADFEDLLIRNVYTPYFENTLQELRKFSFVDLSLNYAKIWERDPENGISMKSVYKRVPIADCLIYIYNYRPNHIQTCDEEAPAVNLTLLNMSKDAELGERLVSPLNSAFIGEYSRTNPGHRLGEDLADLILQNKATNRKFVLYLDIPFDEAFGEPYESLVRSIKNK